VLGFLIFFSLVGVVVFSILCVFASLTVKLIKKHNRSSSNRHPRAKLAFFFRCTPILSVQPNTSRCLIPVSSGVVFSVRGPGGQKFKNDARRQPRHEQRRPLANNLTTSLNDNTVTNIVISKSKSSPFSNPLASYT
jgi:hypothetical protein